MAQKTRKQTFSFSGGLNTKVSDFLLKDDELRIVLNLHYDSIGALTRRSGFTTLGSKPDSNKVLGLHPYYRSDGLKEFMRFGAGGSLHKYVDGSGYTSLLTGLSTSADWDCINFVDNFFFTNGTDTPRSYDGRDISTTRNVTSMPKGKFIAVYKLRVYTCGIAGEPHKAYFSSLQKNFVANPTAAFTLGQTATGGALDDGTYYVSYAFENANGETKIQATQSIVLNGGGSSQVINITGLPALPTGATAIRIYIRKTTSTPLYRQGTTTSTTYDQTTSLSTSLNELTVNTTAGVTWASGDNLDVGTGDDGEFTGMDVVNDRLVFYLEFAVYRWDGYKLVKADIHIGSVSNTGIARIGKFDFYPNREGVFVYDGIDVKLISAKIEDYIRAINQSTIGDLAAIGFLRKFYLAVGTTSTYKRAIAVTKACLVYDYDQNAWTVYDNIDANIWSTFIISGVENLYFGTSTGEIMKFLTGNNDNSSPISYRARTKKHFLGDPSELKNLNKVYSFQENGAGAKLDFILEGRSPLTIKALQQEMETVDVFDSGRYLELEIYGSDDGEPCGWNGFQVEQVETDLKGGASP